jgi:type IV protein arginine methyltransferase
VALQVRVLFGRWQDVVGQLEQYDGIFFDTYSEHYLHMREFHNLLPRILKKDGLYTFFNGLAPRCPFFSMCDAHQP